MFDIISIGHPMTVLEIEVESSRIRSLGLTPGHSVDRPAAWLATLGQGRLTAGGSAATTAAMAALMGARTGFAGLAGDDKGGRFFAREMMRCGVQAGPVISERARTGLCVALVDETGERTMATDTASGPHISIGDIRSVLRPARFTEVEGYILAAATPTIEAALGLAREQGSIPVISLATPALAGKLGSLVARLTRGGIVIGNEEEIVAYAGGMQNDVAVRSALERGADIVVMTRGAKGAIVASRSEWHEIPAVKTKLANTIGAGDGFAGGFLAALSANASLAEAGMAGAFAGSHMASLPGAWPDKQKAELLRIKTMTAGAASYG